MNAQAAVAIILALAVLFFVINGTLLRAMFIGPEGPVNDGNAQAWKDIVNVIIGALAGFIARHPNAADRSDKP